MFLNKQTGVLYKTRAELIGAFPELAEFFSRNDWSSLAEHNISALHVVAPEGIDYNTYALNIDDVDVDALTVTLVATLRPEIDFDRLRGERLTCARAAVDAAARALVAHIPATEQQTWPTQLAEAQAIQIWRNTPEALPDGTAPLLTVMAAERGYGESVFDLADRVLSAAAQYTAAAGPLIAWGQRTERALMAAQNFSELNAISLTPPAPAPALESAVVSEPAATE